MRNRSSAGVHRVTAGPCRFPGNLPACRWCGGVVEKPRRTFCGDRCVEQWGLCFNQAAIRRAAYLRDHEICAMCGRDCRALGRELNTLSTPDRAARMAELGLCRYPAHHRLYCTCDWGSGVLWQADHVVPVSRGGLMLGLANIRTLCRWCHRGETTRLAREREAFVARQGAT